MSQVKENIARDKDAIEEMIDRYGMSQFLSLVSGIAIEKSEHIVANYGNDMLARHWSAVGVSIDDLSRKAMLGNI